MKIAFFSNSILRALHYLGAFENQGRMDVEMSKIVDFMNLNRVMFR
jgi:hypothetical protein